MRTVSGIFGIGAVQAYRLAQLPADWNYAVHGNDWTGAQNGFCRDDGAKFQSPVDLGASEDVFDDMNTLFYWYPRLGEPLKIYNDGKSISATLPDHYKGGFGFGRLPNLAQYRLMQFTFHAPSEHTLNGVRQPLELQLTHAKRGSDRLGITSIFFSASAAGPTGGVPFLDAVVNGGLPEHPWDEVMANLEAPAKNFHESSDTSTYAGPKDIQFEQAFEPLRAVDEGLGDQSVQFYRYDGSLTQPPCTQNVDWFVRKDPVRVAKSTLDALAGQLRKIGGTNGNWREVQFGNFGAGPADRAAPVLVKADWYGNKFNYEAVEGSRQNFVGFIILNQIIRF